MVEGVPFVAQRLANLTSIHHEEGSGVPVVAQQVKNPTMRMKIPSLALLSGLRIRPCCEFWCRSQAQFRSGVAVTVV